MLLDCFRRHGLSFRKVELWDNLFAYSPLWLYLLWLGYLSKRSLISFVYRLLWRLTGSALLQLGVLISLKTSLCAELRALDRLWRSANLWLLPESCEAGKRFTFSSLCSSAYPCTLGLQEIWGWAILLLRIDHRLESGALSLGESLVEGLSLLLRDCVLESRCFLLFLKSIFKSGARSLCQLLQLLAWAQVEQAASCLRW